MLWQLERLEMAIPEEERLRRQQVALEKRRQLEQSYEKYDADRSKGAPSRTALHLFLMRV